MREYTKAGKLVIHSTDLQNYLMCPKKFTLGRRVEVHPTLAMRDGLILEALVYGEKKQGDIEKHKGKKNISQLEGITEKLKPIFVDGKSFWRIETEYKDVLLSGEVDYYTNDILFDLKHTKNLDYWRAKISKSDFVQSVFYTYIDYKNTGKLKEFKYIVTDGTEILPVNVEVTEGDFGWLLENVDVIIADAFFSPNLDACNGKFPCFYRGVCDSYKEKFGEINLRFSELI